MSVPAPSDAPRGYRGGLTTVRVLGLATLVLTGAAAALMKTRAARPRVPSRRPAVPATAALPEARRLHGAAALLAASVLADSTIEHYRGSFENPGMAAPLIAATLALSAGVHGAARTPRGGADGRDGAYAAAVAVGAAGTAFHACNVLRRPGGLSWLNVFYSAPLGAPAALSLAGLIGLAAGRLAAAPAGAAPPRLLGLPAGRALAGLASAGLLGTVGEAGLMHFRGAFQNPFMWLPVTVPPAAAALLARAAAAGGARALSRRFTRGWLAATALLGLGGMGFHAYGVARSMGGWRNWSQNLLCGPPLPAPPSFSALAWAGLAALSLIDREAAAGAQPAARPAGGAP